jgi:Divergent InlB B-repeat domain
VHRDDEPARTVTVVFASFTLTVKKTGVGTGSITSDVGGINCSPTCSAAYPAGTTVTLTATPAAGSSFVSFTGCTAGPGNTCTVVMTSAKTVSAAFQVP